MSQPTENKSKNPKDSIQITGKNNKKYNVTIDNFGKIEINSEGNSNITMQYIKKSNTSPTIPSTTPAPVSPTPTLPESSALSITSITPALPESSALSTTSITPESSALPVSPESSTLSTSSTSPALLTLGLNPPHSKLAAQATTSSQSASPSVNNKPSRTGVNAFAKNLVARSKNEIVSKPSTLLNTRSNLTLKNTLSSKLRKKISQLKQSRRARK